MWGCHEQTMVKTLIKLGLCKKTGKRGKTALLTSKEVKILAQRIGPPRQNNKRGF